LVEENLVAVVSSAAERPTVSVDELDALQLQVGDVQRADVT